MIKLKNRIMAPQRAPGLDAEDDFIAAVPASSSLREVWVGVFVLLGLVSVLVALLAFTHPNMFRGRYAVTTVVESAGGVRKGDPVQMLGVAVGRIQGFTIAPGGGVALQMQLEREHTIPDDSRVVLRTQSMLSGKVAEIIPGTSPTPVRAGAVLAGMNEDGIFENAGELGTQADAVMSRVQALLSEQTVGAVGGSAAELQSLLVALSGTVAEQRAELQALTTSLRRSASGVERATSGEELERSLVQIDQLTAQLNETSATLDQATTSMAVILGRLERGEGTLGKLSTDASLYDNWNQAAENLNRLTEDIQQNPRRYLNLRVF